MVKENAIKNNLLLKEGLVNVNMDKTAERVRKERKVKSAHNVTLFLCFLPTY